ncbi:MAG TPA: ribosome biogenesis GTPase Der [Caldisericia bacterium]|nr:ribosome biogenesis GTPase Der [Caldisericia bacterium]HPF48173.1 ribosome biogenesis GTPase Der [Caldisericia bacterium]HPI83891.1 ribosome biogenesis GTPase Der [Caldisericia bacterium]HPQ92626.1 ribosome biogenesis GTPase Der [Caldisericia bacterium]HRV74276.1 ribosome biogenesis GTPase Der [Caldisericia bacterium]
MENSGKNQITKVADSKLPVVALIGRPSVGKSTIFNRILRRNLVITDKAFGVTRDRIMEDFEWNRVRFTLMDTGGIAPEEGPIQEQVSIQSELALGMADLILYVVDVKTGPIQEDIHVAKLLKNHRDKVILVGNKGDNVDYSEFNFFTLGFGEPFILSAITGRNLAELLDMIAEKLHQKSEIMQSEEESEWMPKIAVAGRPNVGKSSLLNKILGETRLTVSNVAGTTRDAIDTDIIYEGKEYRLIDTAGIVRKYHYDTQLEHVTFKRSQQAIHRSDVVFLVVDGSEGVTGADQQIARYIIDEGRGCVLVVNKIDLVDDKEKLYENIAHKLRFISWVPRISISALTGRKVASVFPKAIEVLENFSMEISTGKINRWIARAIDRTSPTIHKNKLLKIYYVVQTGKRPPRFDFFVNDEKALSPAYERYLQNSIREEFGFVGTPIKFRWRPKS